MDEQTMLFLGKALYEALPKADFTKATYEELGLSVSSGVPFERLPTTLKIAILTIAKHYETAANKIRDFEAAIGAATEEVETEEVEAPAEEAAAEEAEAAPADTTDKASSYTGGRTEVHKEAKPEEAKSEEATT